MSIKKTLAAMLTALAGLTACDTEVLNPFGNPIVLSCPNYFILEDAATVTTFKDGPGRDISDIEFTARMGEIRLACLSQIDRETDSGHLEVEVSPILGIEMGAANATESADIPYFVVITDPEKNIIYREELRAQVSFQNNQTRVALITKPTILELPVTPEIRETYYRVYGGFVLTQEQAEFNRRRIREKLQ